MPDSSELIAYFDMDGTLADYDRGMTDSLGELASPDDPDPSSYTRDSEPPHIKARKDLIKSRGDWWENLPRLQLGWDVLAVAEELGFQITILTQGPRANPIAWSHKLKWCQKHLPGYDVCITRDKGKHYGRVLVDDFPDYVDRWLAWRPRGIVIMPAHDYNEGYSHERVVRYDGENLEEVRKALEWARDREAGKSTPKDYPDDWSRLELMVSPDGEFHAVGGDREPGDGHQPYIGLQRLQCAIDDQKAM